MIDVTAQFPLEPGWPRLVQTQATVTVIHHTATEMLPTAAEMTEEDELNHIRVIHIYHRGLGSGGFPYHGITFPSKRSYLVTPLNRWGAHVAGKNQDKYGWAFAGDFTDRLPGNAQIEGVRDDIAELGKPIVPHKDLGETTCPGRVVEIFDRLTEEEEAMCVLVKQPNDTLTVLSAGTRNDIPGDHKRHMNARRAFGEEVVLKGTQAQVDKFLAQFIPVSQIVTKDHLEAVLNRTALKVLGGQG